MLFSCNCTIFPEEGARLQEIQRSTNIVDWALSLAHIPTHTLLKLSFETQSFHVIIQSNLNVNLCDMSNKIH